MDHALIVWALKICLVPSIRLDKSDADPKPRSKPTPEYPD